MKFPPSLMVFDFTNKRTFTDLMENRFDKSRVTKVNFSAGTLSTKKMLKDDGLSILKQGYQFPNPANIKDPAKEELVRELIEQLKHEVGQRKKEIENHFGIKTMKNPVVQKESTKVTQSKKTISKKSK